MTSFIAANAPETDWESMRAAEARAGETRVNLVRIAALLTFYANHLVQHYFFEGGGEADVQYHRAVNVFVVAWAAAVPLIQRRLTLGQWRDSFSFLVTGWDLVLVTALLGVTPGGPHGGLLVLYFLVIATAPLRLSLRLVHFATLGAMVGYLAQLGYYAYFVVGVERYYAADAADMRIPRVTEIAWLLGLAGAGLLAGQSVRQTKRLASSCDAIKTGGGA